MNKDSHRSAAGIEPIRLGRHHRFKFRCHSGVGCYTQCCRGINIILTPYDILRLKNRLGLSSDEFLAVYTVPQLLEKTDLPVVTLRLLEDDPQSCPFVRDEGCIVYADRPTTCRYYPLGIASLSYKDDPTDQDDGFFFFVNEPHCLGFEENREWSVAEWRRDQGVDRHDEINADWTDLVVRKRSFPPNIKLTEQSKRLFFLASYNIDAFRRFVFESSFLKRYAVAPEMVDKIRSSEIDLLTFGLQWIKSVLFKEDRFNVREKE